jgi:hypothetical protein
VSSIGADEDEEGPPSPVPVSTPVSPAGLPAPLVSPPGFSLATVPEGRESPVPLAGGDDDADERNGQLTPTGPSSPTATFSFSPRARARKVFSHFGTI